MQAEATLFVVDDDDHDRHAVVELARTMQLDPQCYASAHEFLEYFDPQKPGCLVSEVRLPGLMSGVQMQRFLEEQQVALPVIFLVRRIDVATAIEAMRRGAVSVVEKPFREMELWDLIQEALELDASRRREQAARRQIERRLAPLTKVDLDLIDRIAAGESNRCIADGEGVCVRTVEMRRSKLMEKLQVRSLADLVEVALMRRWLLNGSSDGFCLVDAGACLVETPGGNGNGKGRRSLPPR